jgi:predicted permease
MEILKSLSTLIIVILAGVSSRYFKIFKKEDTKKLSSFVYYFSLPALFLVNISRTDLLAIDPLLLIGSLGPILLLLSILLPLSLTKIISKDTFILCALSVVFGSNAFFGLALFETFNHGQHYQEAILASSILGMFGIILSLLFFEYSAHRVSIKNIFQKLSANPLIIAILLGIIFSILRFQNSFLHDALDLLGKTATGLATFILGIFIYDHFSWNTLKKSLGLSFFRALALPAAGFVVITLLERTVLPLSLALKQFLLIQTGIPAAISLAIFAERYNYRIKELTGLIIVTSTLCFLVIGGLFFVYQ